MSGNETTASRTESRKRRLAWLCALALFALTALPSAAFAQRSTAKPKPKPEELKTYTLPYFFTIVGVLAVVSPLCMPVKRKFELPKQGSE